MATTTYSGLSQRTEFYAEAKMLNHAEPVVVLSAYGLTKPMPKNKAEAVKFRRPIPFPSVHGSPLQEGVTPTPRALSYEDVFASLVQYGDLVKITDKVADLAEDPVLADASALCGEQAQETLERVVWGAITAGTSVFYANGSARGSVNTKMSLALQRKIVRALKAMKGKKVTEKVASTVNYGTEAIAPAYLAFGHSNLENDIRDIDGFVPYEKYGSMKALPFEIGKIEDVRYILTPTLVPFEHDGSTTANGMITSADPDNSDTQTVDVYPLVFIAKGAYGLVPLKGQGSIKPMILQPGTPDKADPLGQVGYVGWKTWFTAKVLNETWIARAEVGCTAL